MHPPLQKVTASAKSDPDWIPGSTESRHGAESWQIVAQLLRNSNEIKGVANACSPLLDL